MNAASQESRILRHLQSGKTLTPLEAWRRFGAYRLGARIYKLRRRGYKIKREIVVRGKAHFARYSLA